MLNRIEAPFEQEIEMNRTPSGRLVESYAGGKIKTYDGHSPRTIIDIASHNTHLVIHKFGPFEFNKNDEIDDLFVRKGHLKSEFAVAFGDKKDGGPYEYDVYSRDGWIGNASGKRLDLLIGSMFVDNSSFYPELMENIGNARMDGAVVRYLNFIVIAHRHGLHSV